MIELIPDLPPGFKMTELGPLPKEWEVVLFDNVVLNQRPKVGKVKQQDYKPIGRFPIIDQDWADAGALGSGKIGNSG